MSRRIRALGAVLAVAVAPGMPAFAQTTELPTINVTGTDSSPSLVSPNTAEARRQIEQTPGGVELVPDTAFKDTPALTIKDIVGFVPGVWAQPKWGDDTRISIRGSSLSRNFHLRGIQLYLDGIPINTADGYGDFQEIDPSAYRYVEVYKGGNALRYGANSLGGAINFVTPTGRDAALFETRLDAGSFGTVRSQASTAGTKGPVDWFVTGAAQSTDGYRDHSDGHSVRGSANLGYRVSDDFETRFYLNANTVRQRIPGSVTRDSALTTPKVAASDNVRRDWQRNIDTIRVANKSTLRLGDGTTLDVGVFAVDRHLMHPIYQWLDYRYADYGGFLRVNDERLLAGHRNRLVAGINIHNGDVDNRQFTNLTGAVKGALLSSSLDKSQNYTAYFENSFYVLPQVALVAGTQFLHAVRDREDRFLSDGSQSGSRSFDVWSPKVGVMWDDGAGRQVFANVSRSAEVPSFGENTFATAALSNIAAQTATTYEAGTRGRTPDLTWDLSIYRADIRNELQCLTTPSTPGACTVTNADRTVHQGIEAGLGVAVFKGIAAQGDRVWLNVAYTFSDFRFDGDARYGNNQLPGAPRHYLKAEALYKHPSGFYAGPNVEWVPQAYYVDNANSLTTDAYVLLNARIGYDKGEQFSAYLEIRNLFDTRYIASASIAETANAASALFEPGTGRAIYAGIRYRM